MFLLLKYSLNSLKVESLLCSLCKAKDETYINLLYRCRKTSILWKQLQKFFSNTLNIPSISPQGIIFSFLYDTLEGKLILNHILLIFKNYLYKTRKNKNLTFNILKNLEILKILQKFKRKFKRQ